MSEEMEMAVLSIISNTGMAKSSYYRAVEEASKGNVEKAENLLKSGKEYYLEGHKSHRILISEDADGNCEEVNILMVHAEDQLSSAESAYEWADKMVHLYKVLIHNGINLEVD